MTAALCGALMLATGAARAGTWTYNGSGTLTHSDGGWVLSVYAYDTPTNLTVTGYDWWLDPPPALPLDDAIVGGYRITAISVGAFLNCINLTSVTLPDSVISIDIEAFADCPNLTSVTLGNSVASIAQRAFYYCPSLTSVTFPDSLISIGNEAFYGCTNLTGALTLPDNLASIGAYAFYYCTSLTGALTLPDSLASIGYGAFSYCSGLTSVTFPDNVTYISGFSGCTSLTSVTIPDSVINIYDETFSGCSGLDNISVSAGNTVYKNDGGAVFSKDGTALILCPPGRETYTVPAGVTNIEWWALCGCVRLTNIMVAPENQFYSSDGVVLLSKDGAQLIQYPPGRGGAYTISDSVTSIGEQAIVSKSLTSLVIPDSVTDIGRDALECPNLVSVSLGRGVTNELWEIGLYCDNGRLEEITVAAGNPVYSSIDGVLFSSNGQRLIRFPASRQTSEYIVPEGVTSIGSDSFSLGCGIATVGPQTYFPMESLVLPSTLQRLDTSLGNLSLSLLTFKGSYPVLPSAGLSVKNAEIAITPEHISSWEPHLDSGSFASGDAIWLGVPIRTTAQRYESRTLLSENGLSSYDYDSVEKFTITVPEGGCFMRASIWSETGSSCDMAIENSAGYMDSTYTFYGNEAYLDIICPEPGEYTVTLSGGYYESVSLKVKWMAAASAAHADTWTYNSTAGTLTHGDSGWVLNVSASGTDLTVTGYSEPDTPRALPLDDAVAGGYRITAIDAYAFYDCTSLTSVTIGNDVASIEGGYVFYGCTNLANIRVSSGNTVYSDINGVLYSKDRTQLVLYPPGKTEAAYAIPASVTSIGEAAFDNRNLTSLAIPDGVVDIGEDAFAGCFNLVSLSLGRGVTNDLWEIGLYCDNGRLEEITVAAGNPVYSSIDGVLFDSGGRRLILYPANRQASAYIVPEGVTDINSDAFMLTCGIGVYTSYLPLRHLTLPSTLENLSGGVFGDLSLSTLTFKSAYPVFSGGSPNIKALEIVVTPEHAPSWEPHLDSGSLAVGNAVWRGALIRTTAQRYGFQTLFSEDGISLEEEDPWVWGVTVTVPAGALFMNVAFSGLGGDESGLGLWSEGFWEGISFYGDEVNIPAMHPAPGGKYDISIWKEYAYEGASLKVTWTAGATAVALTASPSALTLGADACGGTIEVSGNTEWTATDDADWLTVSPASGDGGGTITVTATANTGTAPRDATVTVTCGDITRTVTVTQSGASVTPPPSDGYLADLEGGADTGAVPVVTIAYAGFAYDNGGAVLGTVTLSAKMTLKKGVESWSFTAKAILQNATASFSGKNDALSGTLTLPGKSGETLAVTLGADTFYGTLTGGKAGAATLRIAGARDAFEDKKDTVAATRLTPLKGYYTAALVGTDGTAGYLTFTVGNNGSVKLAGKLADGTAVSGSAKLLEGLSDRGWLCIALHKPLYSKKGSIGGLLWLSPADKVLRVDTDYGWYIDWTSADPKKGVFDRALDVCGGWYGTGAALAPSYLFSADVPADLPPFIAGLTGGAWMSAAFPSDMPVAAAAGKFTLPKADTLKKPAKDAPQEYDYSGANPSGTKLTFTAKTGIFKGSFKLYYDGMGLRGLQHKAASASYIGVLTPTRDAAYAASPLGLGSGTVKIGTQKIGISVRLD